MNKMVSNIIISFILFVTIVVLLFFILEIKDLIINYYVFLLIPALCVLAAFKIIKERVNA
ncbi:hypothetical protein BX23_23810 [Escherichia coli O118:H16 str. 2009C-4446]|nr:hypothetical protein BW84_19195 [Escherichia coli O118:H16 str. 06-3256]EZE52312.1 hypothetical protein BX23_23810 [Escherichia coli O118:H16 str. 2009C-4446]